MSGRWTSPRILVPALVVALVLAGGIVLYRAVHHGTRITAVFSRVVGLYPGDDVRILGVRVGQVDRIVPDPDGVRVHVTLQDGVVVPATAQMVIVAPSLVSGRYVQLTPAWTGGPTMPDGAVVDTSRTSVPVEWDELKTALDTFAKDLGPDSPDGSSPLGRALDTTSANLGGQGTSINGTIEGLSQAMDVLNRNRGDLFGTVSNLAKFTGTLRESDQQIRVFADQIDTMTTLLAGNKKDLTASLDGLRKLMPQLQTYLKEDGPLLQQDLAGLRAATDVVTDHRQDLGDLLQTAPVSLSNVQLFYDAKTRSTTGAVVFPFAKGPTQIVCFLISRVVSDPGVCSGLLRLFPFLDTSSKATAARATAPGDVASLLTYAPAATAKGGRG